MFLNYTTAAYTRALTRNKRNEMSIYKQGHGGAIQAPLAQRAAAAVVSVRTAAFRYADTHPSHSYLLLSAAAPWESGCRIGAACRGRACRGRAWARLKDGWRARGWGGAWPGCSACSTPRAVCRHACGEAVAVGAPMAGRTWKDRARGAWGREGVRAWGEAEAEARAAESAVEMKSKGNKCKVGSAGSAGQYGNRVARLGNCTKFAPGLMALDVGVFPVLVLAFRGTPMMSFIKHCAESTTCIERSPYLKRPNSQKQH